MSSIGRVFKLSTFGESHGKAVGVVMEGVPSNVELTEEIIQPFMDRRRPGQNILTTARKEGDVATILSGTEFGKTLGTPICITVQNQDQKKRDYASTKAAPRPGHADLTYTAKYGVMASSGGGRASARETIGRCLAGAVAKQVLKTYTPNLEIYSYVSEVGCIALPADIQDSIEAGDPANMPDDKLGNLWLKFDGMNLVSYVDIHNNLVTLPSCVNSSSSPSFEACTVSTCAFTDYTQHGYTYVEVHCPHAFTAALMAQDIHRARNSGDSVGGVTSTVIINCPIGLGEPVFDKFEALLAQGMMSLPATKGFTIGKGFSCSRDYRGSTHNDPYTASASGLFPECKTNNAGGTLGGITTGAPIYFKTAFKPVSSIGLEQPSAGWAGEPVVVEVKGRHDPCVLPRCPPLTDAQSYITILDLLLVQKALGPRSWSANFLQA